MDAPRDGFKWFEEGFDGFPKSLPEDCIEYTIYLLDSTLTDLERREKLRQVQSAGTELTNRLLKDFIWQREGFRLSLEREDGGSFLQGRTNYGDSVEDEWLILYILRELSKQFPKIWIRTADTDGQFLLIEAANVLPRWLNPEIADFRVWLNNGKLLLVPLERPGEQVIEAKPGPLTLIEALKIIENQPTQLLNLPAVEAEAFYRLEKYPKQILDSLHHALLTVPRKLAYVLHEDVAYISAAVEAFYLRDPIALRPLQASNHNELYFPPTDPVTMSVKFTKVGYAQLKSQQFAAPAQWADYASAKREAISQGSAEMGMKVTCGFEMLMCDTQNQDKKVVREIAMLLEDIRTGQDELPTDAEINKWETREDDEAWLDINFEDFEKELGGIRKPGARKSNEGFGDKGAQENLQKIVARFEDFLNDDAAGADGAEILDDMDNDDEEEDSAISDDSDDEGEDKDVSFDEDAFASMMREMMGMPPITVGSVATPRVGLEEDEKIKDISSGEEDEKGVHQAMQDIENELREAGALNLNLKQGTEKPESQRNAIVRGPSSEQSKPLADAEDASEDGDAEIDFNLAKNLLESFKSQGGVSGPGGNMMSLMGMRLPRDESDRGDR
ncbi:hypothetical protein HO173_006229 [Letharia columbiana]|uniref:Regulatory factor Sgt1 n=1 Tax=Letharia columbiana TaxID=112416 RepID=A0A8H6FVM3_9LECA|nr:uncharacterized protein HO173_006229 [Letharia columbiana]KAF6235546.1 hypothetical protein HO173_006229 [Letharia columbiana]